MSIKDINDLEGLLHNARNAIDIGLDLIDAEAEVGEDSGLPAISDAAYEKLSWLFHLALGVVCDIQKAIAAGEVTVREDAPAAFRKAAE